MTASSINIIRQTLANIDPGVDDDQFSAIGAASLHEPSAQSCKFGIADRACLFQPTELFDFI